MNEKKVKRMEKKRSKCADIISGRFDKPRFAKRYESSSRAHQVVFALKHYILRKINKYESLYRLWYFSYMQHLHFSPFVFEFERRS